MFATQSARRHADLTFKSPICIYLSLLSNLNAPGPQYKYIGTRLVIADITMFTKQLSTSASTVSVFTSYILDLKGPQVV